MEKLFTGIALANLDSTAASITLTAFGRGGELLAGPGILNPATLPLAAGAQIARMDFEVFGDGIGSGAQVGWFQAESTSPGLHGFFLAFDGIVSVLDGTNASKQGTRSFVWPDLSDGDAFIETHIVNPWAEANEIRLQLFDSAGAMREGEIVFRLEANGALLEPLNEVFTTGLGSGDYLRVSAEREVVPLLLWGNRGRYLKALEGQAEENSATTLYAPQYVVGDMWRSTLSVVNLENVPGEVRLEFADRSGNSVTRTRPIAALGKIFIGDQDFFVDPRAGLRQGHVKITGSGMRLAGNVVFGDAEQLRSATALPLVSNLTSEMVFSQFVSNANYYTGVALLNPGDTGARGTVEVFGSDGARLASAPFVLAAGRSDAFVLSTLPELTGMSLSTGYIRIRADQPIAGFALFATHNNAAVSAIPPQSIR
jgi:hypothetical protein